MKVSLPTPAFLSVLCVFAIAWVVVDPTRSIDRRVAQLVMDATMLRSADVVAQLDLSETPRIDLEQIVSRPLFRETRKPKERAPPEPAQPSVADIPPVQEPARSPPASPQVALLGTHKSANKALVLRGEHQLWISVGEDIAGWTLIEVGDHSVLLRQGAHRHSVSLDR